MAEIHGKQAGRAQLGPPAAVAVAYTAQEQEESPASRVNVEQLAEVHLDLHAAVRHPASVQEGEGAGENIEQQAEAHQAAWFHPLHDHDVGSAAGVNLEQHVQACLSPKEGKAG